MAALTNLVTMHSKPWVTVGLYGNHEQMVHQPRVLEDSIDTAVLLGADRNKVCVLVPASGADSDHFQRLIPANQTTCINDRVWADAVWTNYPEAAVILPTADCQTIVIKNLVTGMLVVAHGGKPAMTPGHMEEDPWWNIVDICIAKAVEHADPTNLQIYVTGTISGKNYWHDAPEAQPDMEPFIRVYGNEVFFDNPVDGRLDLFSVTKAVARNWKVPAAQVSSDGLCTYDHPDLVSYRKDSTPHRNLAVVVNKPVER